MARSPSETYRKLLVALDQVVHEAGRAGDEAIRQWAVLAQFDAIELGELLGLLLDDEVERRRAAVRAAAPEFDL